MKTLVLDGTAISIQIAMSTSAATTNPTFVTTYADNSGSGITEGATDGALNGSTDVTAVPAPTGTNRRVIKDITIYNGDTAAVTIFIKYDNNGTQRTLAKVTLAVGDTWTTDGAFDSNGQLKTVAAAVNLATQVFGTLAVNNGGSGASSLTGVLKGNGTSPFSAATAGTDYLAPPSGTALLKANSGAALANAVAGTDYLAPPSGSSILKANFGGALVNAIAGVDFLDIDGALGTPSSGTLTNCTVDGTNSIGYRRIPPVGIKTAQYTLLLSDVGEYVRVSTGGSILVLGGTFPDGSAISIFNNTTSTTPISFSGGMSNAYIAGTNVNKASGGMTLAARGIATVLFIETDLCVVTGNVT
jgi:hypothetical protein